MRYFSLTILCLAFIIHTASAQNNKVSAELLWQLGRVSLDHISPDGQTALYGVTYYNVADNKGNRDLYIVPVAGGVAKKITAFDGGEINGQYTPDGLRIGFLRSGFLWEMNPDGSDQRKVSGEAMNGFLYAPDGKHILYIKDVKMLPNMQEQFPDLPKANARLIDNLMYRHWDSWSDESFSQVFVAPYEAGKITGEAVNIINAPYDSPLNPFGGMEQIAWSPDGQRIAYTCKKLSGKDYAVSTNSDVYLYDLGTGKTSNLTEGMNGYDMEPAWSPDGRYLVWNSMATPGFESDRIRIYLKDFQTNKTAELTRGFEHPAEHPQWSPDSKTVFFSGTIKATHQLFAIDLASQKIKQITQGRHDLTAFAVANNETLVALHTSISDPAELYRADVKSGAITPITSTNKTLWGSLQLGKVEERQVKTTDGKNMLVWMVYPPDFDPTKKYPTLLFCQGGPQSAVSQYFTYRWNFQLMAAKGYIVVAPNRRGLPSFGEEWNNQISGDWGGQAMNDLLSAIDDAKKEPYVDANRLGAVGASFGGFSVFWLAGNHQKRFKAFVSHSGMFNMESWYGTTEEMFFANHDMGGAYWDSPVPASYKKHSPHLYINNWDTPILITHGERDYRVPVTESMQAFQAAQLKGIPSRMLLIPDENHWILSPQNSLLWHRVFYDWLDKYLKN